VEEHAMEASVISCCKEIQDATINRQVMLTIFWDSQGPILETYLERGTTITSATYCDMLQGGLKPVICSKRRGRLSEGVLCCTTMPVPILQAALWRPQEIELGSHGTSISQFRFGTI
jgi:hypothetical protein